MAPMLCALAMVGCRQTAIDVAKGRPLEPEPNFIPSDYKKPSQTWTERLSPDNLGKTMKAAVGLGPNQTTAETHFAAGEKHFAAKQYDAAAKEFKKAAGYWPDSALEEQAMFLWAESHFFADRYSKADDRYGELLKKYPNTRYLDTSVARIFSIGHYWLEKDKTSHRWVLVPNFVDRTQPIFDTRGHGINAMDNVRVNDPRGQLADDAIMHAANTYFVAGRYEDADYYYGLLRTDHPKSEFQLDAHLLGLKSKLMCYQGPGYNGKPLEEAEVLIDQMLVQFPHELGDQRELVMQEKARVRYARADRDMKLAKYFDDGGHHGAAKIYYAEVIKNFPQTPHSDDAKTRLAAIQKEPDHPPNRLALITDLFEKEEYPEVTPGATTVTAEKDDSAKRQ
ncbi:MAG: tetratricopeptide repeat protein [Pirellulales bacterium]|nr:tetratricopeptide repeat protein [Pirellulales bacterium]